MIQVKSWEEMVIEFGVITSTNIIDCRYRFTSVMRPYCGRIFESFVELQDSVPAYSWSSDMVKPYYPKKKKKIEW